MVHAHQTIQHYMVAIILMLTSVRVSKSEHRMCYTVSLELLLC